MGARVVITGIGIISSMGRNKEETLTAIINRQTGIDKIRSFSTEELKCHIGAEVNGFSSGLEEGEHNLCVQLGLEAARQALGDAAIELGAANHSQTGLCFGTCNGGITAFEQDKRISEIIPESSREFPIFQQADQIARLLGIKGPVLTNATACAASGNAMAMAFDLISEGYCPTVLVGGSDTMSESVFAGFHVLQSLSPEPCAPFGLPYGLSLGEGAAFLVFESLEIAQGRGAKIYAEVCGYGLSQDAYHPTAPEPEGAGVARAIGFALRNSGVRPEEIGYINMHGTGTEANDIAEVKGVQRALGQEHFFKTRLSSSKGYFGHTLGAAAAIELVTTLICLEHNLLPGSVNTRELRAGCEDIALVPSDLAKADGIKYFLNNNSGFGGHNSSILLTRNPGLNQVKKADRIRVGVRGLGMVNSMGLWAGPVTERINDRQPREQEEFRELLKDFVRPWYSRRMNPLTQMSIASVVLALEDGALEPVKGGQDQIGLIFGTMYGSADSFGKFLAHVFEKGAQNAHAVYFPDTVHNSTPGKVATKLGLQGCGSTLCDGGNEGLAGAFMGYEIVAKGCQKYCLTTVGEEFSPLMMELNRVLGFDQNNYNLQEGSASILLGDMTLEPWENWYAELLGFGFSFVPQELDAREACGEAIKMALARAKTSPEEINFVYYNDLGLKHRVICSEEVLRAALRGLFGQNVPLKCWNRELGYSFSANSLYPLNLAAEVLKTGKGPSFIDGQAKERSLRKGLVFSTSYNGSNIAVVLGRTEEGGYA